MIDWSRERVLVTGGTGFLGQHLCRMLEERGCKDVAPIGRAGGTDLRDSTEAFSAINEATIVYHLAANVGGIGYNERHGAELLADNVSMGLNVLWAAMQSGARMCITAGTVCFYPANCPLPFREDALWSGRPEPTNAPYGIAKLTVIEYGMALARQHGFDSKHLILSNLYGEGDSFDLADGHCIPSMMRRTYEAKLAGAEEIVHWGSGSPTRDFLHVEDAARALILAAEHPTGPGPINIGTGVETRISEPWKGGNGAAEMIAGALSYEGRVRFDRTGPDGQSRRCLDSSRAWALLGWRHEIDIEDGIRALAKWYVAEREKGRS